MRLSYPTLTRNQNVLALPDILTGSQIEDLLAIDGGVEVEIEGFEGFGGTEGGAAQPWEGTVESILAHRLEPGPTKRLQLTNPGNTWAKCLVTYWV